MKNGLCWASTNSSACSPSILHSGWKQNDSRWTFYKDSFANGRAIQYKKGKLLPTIRQYWINTKDPYWSIHYVPYRLCWILFPLHFQSFFFRTTYTTLLSLVRLSHSSLCAENIQRPTKTRRISWRRSSGWNLLRQRHTRNINSNSAFKQAHFNDSFTFISGVSQYCNPNVNNLQSFKNFIKNVAVCFFFIVSK